MVSLDLDLGRTDSRLSCYLCTIYFPKKMLPLLSLVPPLPSHLLQPVLSHGRAAVFRLFGVLLTRHNRRKLKTLLQLFPPLSSWNFVVTLLRQPQCFCTHDCLHIYGTIRTTNMMGQMPRIPTRGCLSWDILYSVKLKKKMLWDIKCQEGRFSIQGFCYLLHSFCS